MGQASSKICKPGAIANEISRYLSLILYIITQNLLSEALNTGNPVFLDYTLTFESVLGIRSFGCGILVSNTLDMPN